MNIETLLTQKFNNFLNYIDQILPNNEKVAQIKGMNLNGPAIASYLKSKNLNDFDYLFLQLSTEFNIEEKVFTQEHKDKLKLYNEFFKETMLKLN